MFRLHVVSHWEASGAHTRMTLSCPMIAVSSPQYTLKDLPEAFLRDMLLFSESIDFGFIASVAMSLDLRNFSAPL